MSDNVNCSFLIFKFKWFNSSLYSRVQIGQGFKWDNGWNGSRAQNVKGLSFLQFLSFECGPPLQGQNMGGLWPGLEICEIYFQQIFSKFLKIQKFILYIFIDVCQLGSASIVIILNPHVLPKSIFYSSCSNYIFIQLTTDYWLTLPGFKPLTHSRPYINPLRYTRLNI